MSWIAVDFDGTLAEWFADRHGGAPIPVMIERVRRWIAAGLDVRLFTARANEPHEPLQTWCMTYIGHVLPITNVKDPDMLEVWDDRAVAVERNTGRQLSPSPTGLT